MTAAGLRPGDVLLYRAKGLFGRIIAVKTWHPIAHVELYLGAGKSAASRDGQGTGIYPLRESELVTVCRPKVPLDLAAGRRWMLQQGHKPYGWLDLLQFVGLNIDTDGIVCSPFIALLVRVCGLDPFNGEPAVKIAPFQFLVSPVFLIFSYQQEATRHVEVHR